MRNLHGSHDSLARRLSSPLYAPGHGFLMDLSVLLCFVNTMDPVCSPIRRS